jgi:PAS domain S-box-containing protein
MSTPAVLPTGHEVRFGDEDLIVSKTDLKGRITYVNRTFMQIAGYAEHELLGQPHNIIRHPDMPRSVFRYLWDTIQAGREIFAYVKNMTKSGDHYWVFAHVTPTMGANGAISGFHSNRRTALRPAIAAIEPIYAQLRAEEMKHDNPKDGAIAGVSALEKMLHETGRQYDEFVFAL